MEEVGRNLNGWEKFGCGMTVGGLLLAVLGMMALFSGDDGGGGALLVGLFVGLVAGPVLWIYNRPDRRG
jgi:hypothetical protein